MTVRDLPLFAEPRKLTLAERFTRWVQSKDGVLIYTAVKQAALEAFRNGAKRVEVNLLWARARAFYKVPADNSFRALAARLLLSEHPELATVIHTRARKAA